MEAKHSGKPSQHITEARAAAQRAKLDGQTEEGPREGQKTSKTKQTSGKKEQRDLLTRRRATTTLEHAIADYLADHEGGNSSPQTVQWYSIALGLLRSFLESERGITLEISELHQSV